MNRELRITDDGSHTVFYKDLDEPYHSVYGAIQESRHVFIEQGFFQLRQTPVRILEVGLGTALNLLLTVFSSEEKGTEVYYHAVEKYPLLPEEYNQLNFNKFLPDHGSEWLSSIHDAAWDTEVRITNWFTIFKERSDVKAMKTSGRFDLVYFDAFAPDKQPELWGTEVFTMLATLMNQGAVLVTYTAKGSVRRTMQSCGFRVEKVPGPPGKREMIRAVRI
jgi:tRNA U34 5-methylaminomethyl-2-thiouridine-forming methyltransferase MnmC